MCTFWLGERGRLTAAVKRVSVLVSVAPPTARFTPNFPVWGRSVAAGSSWFELVSLLVFVVVPLSLSFPIGMPLVFSDCGFGKARTVERWAPKRKLWRRRMIENFV